MDWISLLLVPAIKSLILIFILLTGFAYLSYVERKLVARFQERYGPNLAGPFGLLQPLADAVKMFFKEEIIPRHVDRVVYLLAPALTVVPALIVWAVIPLSDLSFTLFGQPVTMYVADVNVALLYVLAIASLNTYGIVLAGWSSNNKYSLLGALRTVAQMLSYELPMGVALVRPGADRRLAEPGGYRAGAAAHVVHRIAAGWFCDLLHQRSGRGGPVAF